MGLLKLVNVEIIINKTIVKHGTKWYNASRNIDGKEFEKEQPEIKRILEERPKI